MTISADVVAALPEYEVGEELGRGAYGLVVAGFHRQLRRAVAIKELLPALAGDPTVRARFAVEARVLAALNHPHIVPIYDYVERDGICLLVMENLPGGTLWDHFRRHGLSVGASCAVTMATCAALHYAHQRGVLHRDVKPENILYSADGVLKVTDFGIAKVVGGGDALATKAGEILGTPAYMAPEQAQGSNLGPAADVYSTGIMLYELLSGQLPFSEEGGPLSIVYRHIYEDAIPLGEVAPRLDPGLVDVTMHAIARLPGDRFASAEAFGAAIGQAAASALGPGWLDGAGLEILDVGPIVESTMRPTLASPVVGPGASRGPTLPPATGAPPPRPGRGDATIIRPRAEDHVGGPAGFDIDRAELLPVREAMALPGRPYAPIAAAVVLLLVAVAVALGTSPVAIGGNLPFRAEVGGHDVSTATPVQLDLSKMVPVKLTPPPADDTSVQIGFSVGGIPLPPSTTERLTAGQAEVRASTDRYLLGGMVTGDVRLMRGAVTLGHRQFLARGRQPDLLTVPGMAMVILLLVFLAQMGSLVLALRRGQRQVPALVGLALLGGGLGATVAGLAWVAGRPEPRAISTLVGAACGSAAAMAAGAAAIRIARRARIEPKRARTCRA